IHTDQGCHYQHRKFISLVKKNHVIKSMSRKATCLDNAVMESFFHILKAEMNQSYKNKSELTQAVKAWINYYNNDRIKEKLGGLSPIQYRKQTA
ncbi:IS3 family transposase, partial [Fructilactobacillus fructivorans]